MKKNILLSSLALAAVMVLSGCGLETSQPVTEQNVPAEAQKVPEPPKEAVIGGDVDEHGCLGPAGYSWCEPKNKCLRVWEEACYASPGQEIQYLLAEKYDKAVSEVNIKVNKQMGDYISGGVKFGQGGVGEGGMFLARKTGNMWELAFDGNGTIDCQKMRQEYGFPDSILKPNFCD